MDGGAKRGQSGAMSTAPPVIQPAAQPASWPSHFSATLKLGVPIIGSLIAQMLITLTDTVMIGWYGVDELAALVLATSVFFVVFIVGSGFAFAVMPMAASAEGEGDVAQVRRVTRMGLWISVIWCAFWMPVLWQFEWLALAIGQEAKVALLAQDYMRIAQWAMFPGLVIMVLKSFLSALERPGWVLWATVIGAVANVIANYALIFGHWGAPEMGVQGAAVASVVTHVVMGVVIATYCHRQPILAGYGVFVRLWRSDWPAFLEVFRLGWPIGLTMLAEVGLFSATAVMMGWIGTLELATHGIAIQIASMAFMIYLGLAQTATIRVGRALGRRDRVGIVRASAVVVILQLGMAVVMIGVLLLLPEALISLFLDRDDPASLAIIAYGSGLLLAAAAFQVVDGLQVVVMSVLRGLKDTRVPMWCAALSYWGIGIPVSTGLGFGLGYGGYGIWSGLVVGLSVAAATMIWRLRVVMARLSFGVA